MADYSSHSRLENDLAPQFRARLNHAESSEDVKKFFAYTMLELLGGVLGEDCELHYEDIALNAGAEGYRASKRLAADPLYRRALAESDLGAIMRRFAEAAQHRARHLATHPEKTQSKIRARQGT